MGKTDATPTAFRTALNLAAKKMSKETGMVVLGLQGCRTLPEAVQAAQTFLDPLLYSTVAGDWDPARAAWRH